MSKKKSRLPAGVKELPDGRYHVRATAVDPATGDRIYKKGTLPAGATLAEAVALREELRSRALEVAQEEAKPLEAETLGVYARQWLARKASTWRPMTAETWVRRLTLHVLPEWGSVEIRHVTRRRLLAWRDKLQSQIGAFSERTVQGWWNNGLQFIRDALAEHELHDCTARLPPPTGSTEPRREVRTLSAEEAERLVDAMRARSRHWIVVALAVYTGCRRGEAFALRWRDVDLERRLVYIERSAVPLSSGGYQWTPPKNGKARVAGMPPALAQFLQEHRQEFPGLPDALITRTASGNPPTVHTLNAAIHNAAKAAGIKQRVTLQVLRRTFVSLALASGQVDHEVLRSMVGHAGEAMTRHYHHARADTLRAAADAMWPVDVARQEPGPGDADRDEEEGAG